MAPPLSLRERARGAVRDEVMRQAWVLFAQHGFEGTTVEQVVEAAGMSRRTFFRYFSGKDELLIERLMASAEEVATTLRDRPPGEPAWIALRAAFDGPVRAQQDHPDVSRPLQLMLRDEAAVGAAVRVWQRRLVELLAPLVADRLPGRRGSANDVRATAMAGSALACLQAAQEAWAVDTSGPSLRTRLDQAMGAVAPLSSRR